MKKRRLNVQVYIQQLSPVFRGWARCPCVSRDTLHMHIYNYIHYSILCSDFVDSESMPGDS